MVNASIPVYRLMEVWVSLLLALLISGLLVLNAHGANGQGIAQDVVENPGNGQGVLTGTVIIGSLCSVPSPGNVCTPKPGAFRNVVVHAMANTNNSSIDHTAQPNAQGQYRLILPVGVYQVSVSQGGKTFGPGNVVIQPGQTLHLQNALDMGLH